MMPGFPAYLEGPCEDQWRDSTWARFAQYYKM